MGASAFLKSVDFKAFAVNVKTIAPKKYLYQSGHAIWWGQAPNIMYTFIEHCNLSGKIVIPFCTSASSGAGTSATNLQAADTSQAVWLAGRRFSGSSPKSDVVSWLDGLGLQ